MTTRGEYLVGITFNPGGNEHVNEIKRRAADLIDYLHAWDTGGNPEAGRLIALAKTHIEDGAMWGVKAVTKPPYEG